MHETTGSPRNQQAVQADDRHPVTPTLDI